MKDLPLGVGQNSVTLTATDVLGISSVALITVNQNASYCNDESASQRPMEPIFRKRELHD